MRLCGSSAVFLLFLDMTSVLGDYYEHRNRLQQVLLGSKSDYNSNVDPKLHNEISFHLVLKSLTNMNIEAQTMSMKYIINVGWLDPRLSWDPQEYGNLTSTKLDASKIWFPPLYVGNKISAEGFVKNNMRPAARYDGFVIWQTELSTETECAVTTKHYPFDQQRCSIEFGLWETEAKMEFVTNGVPYFYGWFASNAEWDIVNTTAEVVLAEWAELAENLQSMVFTFTLSRKRIYYVTAIIVPVLLLSVLIVAVFWVPIQSGEKIGYCLTILLTYTLFLSIVSDELPPIATDVSYLQLYLAISMILSFNATIISILVLNLYHKGDVAVPNWLKNLTNCCLLPLKCQRCNRKKDSVENLANEATPGVAVVTSFGAGRDPWKKNKVALTYRQVAVILDRFFLYLYIIVVFLLTAFFIILLTYNG